MSDEFIVGISKPGEVLTSVPTVVNASGDVIQAHVPVPEDAPKAEENAPEAVQEEVKATETEETQTEEVKPKLAKRLVDIRAREEALAQKDAELAEKEQAIITKERLHEEFKKDPNKVLEILGMDFEQFTTALLSNHKTEDQKLLNTLQEEVAKLKDEKEAKTSEQIEAEEKAAQEYIDNAIKDFKTKNRTYIDSKPDDFELIRANDAYDLVYDVVEAYYLKWNKILDLAEAAKSVEDHLLKRVSKLKESKKVRGLFAPEEPPSKQAVNTLTNRSVAFAGSNPNPGRKLSEDESIKEAAKLIRWN